MKDYYVAYYDVNGDLMGFYGEDIGSGGYPWIANRVTQAVSLTYEKALDIAENSFNWSYYRFDDIDHTEVVRIELKVLSTVTRETAKQQVKARLIAVAEAKLAAAQAELNKLKGS